MNANTPPNASSAESWQDRLIRYCWALGIVFAAIVLRRWLEPVLGKQGGLLFWIAIFACPWVGGVVPSIIGQSMIWWAQWFWYTPPASTPWRPSFSDLILIAIYYLFGSTIGVASDLRRKAQRRANAQQAEANSQREQLYATLTCMADGVVVTDDQGRLTLMNPAAETMTGCRLHESRGQRLEDLFSIDQEELNSNIANPLRDVRSVEYAAHNATHLLLTSRAGSQTPIAFSAAPLRNETGGVTGRVLIFRDESERRRSEEALRNADRQKDEFLATLAHELRNPLAPICMGLELLRLSSHTPATRAEVCEMMSRQSQHMVRLIDDLMDVSRITRGKLELRRRQIALDEILRNAIDASRPLIDQAGLQLSVKLLAHPILLYADPNRLTQVFSNLLNNAAKFTPPHGRIELMVEGQGSHVTVAVSDTGIGIPDDKRELIFDMFAQIDRGDESVPSGLGIGLTLVKRLVEMHGGTIEVASEGHNLGSTLRVRLPIAHAGTSPHTIADAAAGGRPIVKRRVLIVDDNADALTSLSMVVRALGSETFNAHDGLEAVECAGNLRPDVILMDIRMPRLNGYDAARRIRQQSWGNDVLMVATTGWGKEEDRKRSKEAGFDLHLVKPIEVSAVQELLAAPSRAQFNALPLP